MILNLFCNHKSYIVFITKNFSKTIKINLDNNDEIYNILENVLINIYELLCVDVHIHIDLYNNDIIRLPQCIISYCNGKSKTTKQHIKQKILNNEILFGIIVYNKNIYPTFGTKGWIIAKMIEINRNIKIYYIDDSIDQINSIKYIQSNNLKTILYK